MKLKGKKIRETFNDFLENHPEIKVQRDEDGDMINVIPSQEDNGVEITSQTVVNHEMVWLGYTYKGKEYKFSLN